MANDQLVNGQPQSVEHNRNSRADLENTIGMPDTITQQDDTSAAQPVNPQRGTTPHADKAA